MAQTEWDDTNTPHPNHSTFQPWGKYTPPTSLFVQYARLPEQSWLFRNAQSS